MGEGITGGDVDFTDFWGKAVDDTLEQGFVGKDDGCFATGLDAIVFLKPCGYITGLDVVCWSRDDGDVLGCLFIVVLNNHCSWTKVVDKGLFYGVKQVEADENILT